MNILLTNDDGVSSVALITLANSLREAGHKVVVVAPNVQRSGTSHAVSMFEPIIMERVDEDCFSCTGYPADCVIYAFFGAIDFVPDLVLSGINLGPNLGTDVIYSGTAAAARQGTLSGSYGIAFSLCSFDKDYNWQKITDYITFNLDNFLKYRKPDTFININFPKEFDENEQAVVTTLGKRVYHDSLKKIELDKNKYLLYLSGFEGNLDCQENSDTFVVSQNRVSLSVVKIYPDA